MRKTPLTDWHKAKGAKMAPFAGFEMPIQYEGIIAEHNHTRQSVGIFDICHMGEFSLKGAGAKDALNALVTQDLDTLAPGKCRYGFLPNDQGGVIDDLIIYCLGQDDYMLVVNGACEQGDFDWIKSRLPGGAASLSFVNISEQTGKIDVQGPKSLEVMEAVLGQPLRGLGYFNHQVMSWNGRDIRVSRTGYTGELGYEIYLDSTLAPAMWEALAANGLVKPIGLGARDTLRLEMGYPLYGQDLDTEHTPVEAGYGVLLTKKTPYTAQSVMANVKEKLVPLVVPGRRSARHYDEIYSADGTKKVGMVTSGSFAPSLGHCIALGYVAAADADADAYLVRTQRGDLEAKRGALPFNPGGTARMKLV